MHNPGNGPLSQMLPNRSVRKAFRLVTIRRANQYDVATDSPRTLDLQEPILKC
jgi:hypothetical protein